MAVAMPATPPPDPTVITAPTVTGTPQVGKTLTASPGTWQDQQKLTFDYLWLRNGYSTGVTATTYVVQPDDWGSAIEVRVDAARRLRHTWAYSPAVVIGAPGMFTPAPPTVPSTTRASAVYKERPRHRRSKVILDIGVTLDSGRAPYGYIRVTERGRVVRRLPLVQGHLRLVVPHPTRRVHTYVVDYLGGVDAAPSSTTVTVDTR